MRWPCRRELPRFIATTAPSDSRAGRQAVIVSRRSLIRITDHQVGSLRFLLRVLRKYLKPL
jgi:hypothetical protein